MSRSDRPDRDALIQNAVWRQLQLDPGIDAGDIAVTASDDTITLTGYVATYAGKLEAERAAKRVRGVRAVANELKVRLRFPHSDAEIAHDAAAALRARPGIPESVQASVRYGHLVLTGFVPWLFHRTAAELAVRTIAGVVQVTNRIEVLPLASGVDLRRQIAATLATIPDIDARQINVTVQGTTVVLTGIVESWPQREAVESAAADAPGIAHVENLIEIAYYPDHP
jgi:osmotically-inducible protein OsmY